MLDIYYYRYISLVSTWHMSVRNLSAARIVNSYSLNIQNMK